MGEQHIASETRTSTTLCFAMRNNIFLCAKFGVLKLRRTIKHWSILSSCPLRGNEKEVSQMLKQHEDSIKVWVYCFLIVNSSPTYVNWWWDIMLLTPLMRHSGIPTSAASWSHHIVTMWLDWILSEVGNVFL